MRFSCLVFLCVLSAACAWPSGEDQAPLREGRFVKEEFPGAYYGEPASMSCANLGLDVKTWGEQRLVDYICPQFVMLKLASPQELRECMAQDLPVALRTPVAWRTHVVRQLNGGEKPFQLSAKFQIVTENWNRVVAVPYIVYMPEKDRLLMLVGCDYPHHAMVLTSDDHGAAWTDPRPVWLDKEGKTVPGLGTSLTYLGNGRVMLATDRLWFSSDYGATWGGPDAQTDPLAIQPAPDGKPWNLWDPMLPDKNESGLVRLVQTGYEMDNALYSSGSGPGYSTAYIRFSSDGGRTWPETVAVPQWKGVSEVALLRAGNGDMVAACRTDIPAHFKGETLDHYEGLAVSISKDSGHTWSDLKRLYDWGRHHPSMVLMPNGGIVMTYVVRKGYVDTADGFIQFGIEAIMSRDNGRNWDLDHRYILHSWAGNRKGPEAWWASSQATSSVLLPDGSILTAFGAGYRSQPGPNGPTPRDAGLVLWRLNEAPVNSGHTITEAASCRPAADNDAPFDSDLRNIFNPSL